MKQQALLLCVLSLLQPLTSLAEEEGTKPSASSVRRNNSSCGGKAENRYSSSSSSTQLGDEGDSCIREEEDELEASRERVAARIEAWWQRVLKQIGYARCSIQKMLDLREKKTLAN